MLIAHALRFAPRSIVLALALALAGCTSARTEILVEVDSDLLVPDQLDRVEIEARDPDGRTQSSAALLGPGEIPLPRALGMAWTDGPLGPYTLIVRGELDGTTVVSRTATVSFVRGQTLVLRVELLGECIGEMCGAGLTCARGGCRSIEIAPSELVAWDGQPPPRDAAGIDACVPDERCNGIDDDCDGEIDEGFDFATNPMHCGGCNVACNALHTTSSCVAGECVVTACEAPWDDCDGQGPNGCETDTSTSATHCGACGTVCVNPDRVCCASVCARGC